MNYLKILFLFLILLISCKTTGEMEEDNALSKEEVIEPVEVTKNVSVTSSKVTPKVNEELDPQLDTEKVSLRTLKLERRALIKKMKATTDPAVKAALQKDYDKLTRQIQKIKRSLGRMD